MGISQEELAKTFRQAELQRREGRRQRLLNEVALADEPLNAFDKVAHKAAVQGIIHQERVYQHMLAESRGYWRTLWRALCGKI